MTLTATPDQGWQFDKWEINGNAITSTSAQITISANTTAVATFKLLDGIEQVEYTLKVYPNPTISIVNIESKSVIKNIQVLDLAGRILRSSENITNDKGNVDLTGLPSGIYLLKVMSIENSIQIIKITKR